MLKGLKNLWFPDISFQLLRSRLPSHQQLVRCPEYLSSREIKEYMEKLYGVKVLDVRSMLKQNYVVEVNDNKYKVNLEKWKEAILTLDENFSFPPPPEKIKSEEIKELRNKAKKEDIFAKKTYTASDIESMFELVKQMRSSALDRESIIRIHDKNTNAKR